MTNIYDLTSAINDTVHEQILDRPETKKLSYDEVQRIFNESNGAISFDMRAIPPHLWVNRDLLVIKKGNRGRMDYYGGFEYLDQDCVTGAGDYVVYSAEDDLVEELIGYLNGNTTAEKYDDEEE